MAGTKIRHTKRGTIARVEREYQALDATVRRLGVVGLARPVPGFGARARIPRERWRARDALAHIVEWKRQVLRGLRREGRDPALRGLPIERQNRVLYDRWRVRPSAELVRFHRAVHRDVIAALRSRPEDYFRDPPRSPAWPNDLVGHSAQHRARHLEPTIEHGR